MEHAEPQSPEELRRERARRKRARARGARKRGERGVALIMVLTALTLLFILSQQTREDVEVYSRAAAASRDQVIAYYQAKSGINLARLLLHSEPTIRRALTPVLAPMMMLMGRGMALPQIPIWEQADLLLGVFRNRDGAQSFGQAVGVDFSSARNVSALSGLQPIVIADEDAKINVNGFERGAGVRQRVAVQLYGLVRNPALDDFFSQPDLDNQRTDREALVQAIIDFADPDVDAFDVRALTTSDRTGTGGQGQEDTFYSTLNPPYLRRNAPYDSVNELRLVRGLNDDALWQRIIDPDPNDPRRRNVTVWGQGLVNVNTANAQTMLAVICASAPAASQCTDAAEAAMFISGISMIQTFTLGMGIPLFSNPRGFVDTIQGRPPFGQLLSTLGVRPFVLTAASALEGSVSTESKVFSLYAEALVGLARVRLTAVLDMRAQPNIPGTFLRAVSGGREAAAQNNTMPSTATQPTPGAPPGATPGATPGAPGAPGATPGATVTTTAAGGTIIYWRED